MVFQENSFATQTQSGQPVNVVIKFVRLVSAKEALPFYGRLFKRYNILDIFTKFACSHRIIAFRF